MRPFFVGVSVAVLLGVLGSLGLSECVRSYGVVYSADLLGTEGERASITMMGPDGELTFETTLPWESEPLSLPAGAGYLEVEILGINVYVTGNLQCALLRGSDDKVVTVPEGPCMVDER